VESPIPVREVAGRLEENLTQPLLSVEIPPRSVAPLWGIAGILGLAGLLGWMVSQRMGQADRGWTRWEKHELTGVVLGQNPDHESDNNSHPKAAPQQRSSAPPLWAQAESQDSTVRETALAQAPVQGESSSSAADPFAGAISISEPQAKEQQQRSLERAGRTATARKQIASDELDPAFTATAVDQKMHPEAGRNATPAHLDFAASPVRRTADRQEPSVPGMNSSRYQRVQQMAGTDDVAEVVFPEPAAPVSTARREMPIQTLPERNELPSSSPGIPSSPGGELSLDPVPTQRIPSLPSERLPEASAFEPQPTLSSPSAPQMNPQPQFRQPEMMPSQQVHSGREIGLPRQQPSFSPSIEPQQPGFQPRVNEPIPRAAVSHPMTLQPTGAPAVTLKPDEIHQVQSGDNYWTISRRFYGSARFFSALAEYNKHRIPAPEKMKPGMYVLVPDIELLHQRYPHLTGGGPRDPAETAPPGFFVDSNGQPCYRVGKGDTLTDIAQTYLGRSSRWMQIQQMNQDRLENGKTLKIGLVLRLPEDASQVVLAPADAEIR